jgi:hypothetical protein
MKTSPEKLDNNKIITKVLKKLLNKWKINISIRKTTINIKLTNYHPSKSYSNKTKNTSLLTTNQKNRTPLSNSNR